MIIGMQRDQGYELLDSGDGRKLERFGGVVLARPCAQAIWRPGRPQAEWDHMTDASFDREGGQLRWHRRDCLPPEWEITIDELRLRLSGTDFGHLGVFPEQRDCWRWIDRLVRGVVDRGGARPRVLNLFAYSGGATLIATRAGAEVCHLDASAGMVDWARRNAALNGLSDAPVRWIVDDAHKFMNREARRGRRYDAIILDPPSFGRGARGEVYKLERDLPRTLKLCAALLSDRPLFLLLSAHTPGVTPTVLSNLLDDFSATLPGGGIHAAEMLLKGAAGTRPVPSGCMACWSVSLSSRIASNEHMV